MFIFMTNFLRTQLILIAITSVFIIGHIDLAFATDKIVIGTGGSKGVYYQVGKTICQNAKREKLNIKCLSKATKGSAANLQGIRNGKFDIVVAHSLWAERALNGTTVFSTVGPDTQLRSLFSFHPEPLKILARKDANIRTAKDLKGRRINVGAPGSFTDMGFKQLIQAHGWSTSSFSSIGNLSIKEQGNALCSNNYDAVVYSVGYPSSQIVATAKKCKVTLVELAGPRIDKLVRSHKYLRNATIPSGAYKGISTSTNTFGMGAVVLTNANVSEDTIYNLVKAVFSNLEKTNANSNRFNLKPSEMIEDSLTAKLHPGAIKFYREKGWIN